MTVAPCTIVKFNRKIQYTGLSLRLVKTGYKLFITVQGLTHNTSLKIDDLRLVIRPEDVIPFYEVNDTFIKRYFEFKLFNVEATVILSLLDFREIVFYNLQEFKPKFFACRFHEFVSVEYLLMLGMDFSDKFVSVRLFDCELYGSIVKNRGMLKCGNSRMLNVVVDVLNLLYNYSN